LETGAIRECPIHGTLIDETDYGATIEAGELFAKRERISEEEATRAIQGVSGNLGVECGYCKD
jgi:hypothetical protein